MDDSRRLRNYKPSPFKAEGSIYKERFADSAVAFINQLKHKSSPWEGMPFELLDWQEQIVRDIFGIVKKKDETRQFKRVYIELPKKNGKSELAAAIALLLTCADWEYGGEIYGCATDRQQASIVFDVALHMVQQNAFLRKNVTYSAAQRRLYFKPFRSFYQVVSADYGNKDGFNAHGIIFDELHAQKSRELFDVMTSGSGLSRQQQMTFIITTAGFDKESICWKQHQRAQAVLSGEVKDPTLYPVIFGIKQDEDWHDEEVWKRVNPSYGVTIIPDNFRDEYRQALTDPIEQNTFRRLNLNDWVTQYSRWMPMDLWDACAGEIDHKALLGRTCYGGLDLSFTDDMTAFVLAFPPEDDDDDRVILLPFFWIPDYALRDRMRKDHAPYGDWITKGLVEATKGRVIDYTEIRDQIKALSKKYKIKEIAFDRYGARVLMEQMRQAGLTVTEFGQGYIGMNNPTKEMLRMVKMGRILHGGNPVLRWHFDNAIVKIDEAGSVKPDKKKATEKIDGAVASIMALDLAMRHKPGSGPGIHLIRLDDGLSQYY